MNKFIFLTVCCIGSFFTSIAQPESIVQDGEFGITVGAAHYFGDLNPRTNIGHPGPAIGVFYMKQYSNYLGLRLSAHFAQVGYADRYSKNDFQKKRNLDFNTNIFEVALSGEFNFFKFIPGDDKYVFTPFITLGFGAFSFNPYTTLDGRKVYLQPLGTEGQNIGYTDSYGKRKPYKTYSYCMPFGIGIKYNVSKRLNLSLQVAHRLTFTDYLDDVSTTYVGADKFSGDPTALALQDRSTELGTPIGVEGRQRGWSKQKDQYVIAEIGIAFTISSYHCPTNY
jgi:hypothetical protein